jgi:hypothetical protein
MAASIKAPMAPRRKRIAESSVIFNPLWNEVWVLGIHVRVARIEAPCRYSTRHKKFKGIGLRPGRFRIRPIHPTEEHEPCAQAGLDKVKDRLK